MGARRRESLMWRKSARHNFGYLPAMTETSHFQQLLAVAREQSEPHRLLFVFAAAELPDRPTPAQRAHFLAGRGGALAPLMCVDKSPSELTGFEALAAESELAGPPWQVVFAAALSGRDGKPPEKDAVESALQSMVEAVRLGAFGRFAAYDRRGDPLVLS